MNKEKEGGQSYQDVALIATALTLLSIALYQVSGCSDHIYKNETDLTPTPVSQENIKSRQGPTLGMIVTKEELTNIQ